LSQNKVYIAAEKRVSEAKVALESAHTRQKTADDAAAKAKEMRGDVRTGQAEDDAMRPHYLFDGLSRADAEGEARREALLARPGTVHCSSGERVD